MCSLRDDFNVFHFVNVNLKHDIKFKHVFHVNKHNNKHIDVNLEHDNTLNVLRNAPCFRLLQNNPSQLHLGGV